MIMFFLYAFYRVHCLFCTCMMVLWHSIGLLGSFDDFQNGLVVW